MMTIPSIDDMSTSANTPIAGLPSVETACPVVLDDVMSCRPPVADLQPAFEVLAELVADNEALGKALQSLVDRLDDPQRVAVEVKPVVSADAKPATIADATLVVAANLKPAAVVDDNPVAVELPTPLTKTIRTEVVSPASQTAVIPEAPLVENASETFVRTSVSVDGAVVGDDELTDDAVVLQPAAVVPAPVADSVTPVRETAVDSVSAVSRVSPIDVSSMFLAAAEEVAAAVTVSPSLMRGEAGEIRVQLRPDVLEGAEVVVSVDGKKMDVTFVPTVTHVADTVAANQTLVQQHLAARIVGFEISVAVAQTVATNVSVGVASTASAQAAVARARRTNGRA